MLQSVLKDVVYQEGMWCGLSKGCGVVHLEGLEVVRMVALARPVVPAPLIALVAVVVVVVGVFVGVHGGGVGVAAVPGHVVSGRRQ